MTGETMLSEGSESVCVREFATADPPMNALTVDVEDYFHVAAFQSIIDSSHWDRFDRRVGDNMRRILDLFERTGVKATFFVLGWVADKDPEIVKRIHSGGHEIACHSYAHRLIYEMSVKEFREDVGKAKAILEDVIGGPVLGFRAPTYSIVRSTFWAFDVLAELGFQYDSSIFPIVHDRYGVPDASRFPFVVRTESGGTIIEFPLTTLRVLGRNIPIAGGGYFRLFPLWFSRWALKRINSKERKPVIFYFHPWELDPGQPVQPVGRATRFRHYHNLGKMERRVERLLGAVHFSTVRDVLRFPTPAHGGAT